MAKQGQRDPEPPRPLPPPSQQEIAAIKHARATMQSKTPRLCIEVKYDGAGKLDVFGPDHNDHDGWVARLHCLFGSVGHAFAGAQISQLTRACQTQDGKVDEIKLNGMLAVVEGAKPENEIQGMLAVQMAITHAVALQTLLRAQRAETLPQVDSAGSLAVKLLRTFTTQAETLAKLQRGGEQVVKVVHVHPGGQAIVGDVHNAAGGGGTNEKGNQPHAKAEPAALSAPTSQEMLRLDPQRDAVPVARS